MMQRGAKHKRDTTGVLQQLGDQCIAESFPLLQYVSIIYAWRDPPKYDQQRNQLLFGECRKLPNRDRDLYGVDVVVIIAKAAWKEMTAKERYRLIWHELYHIDVQVDDTMRPEKDQDERVKIRMRKHDLELPRFKAEIDKFGPTAEERVWLRRVSKIYAKVKDHGQVQTKIKTKRRKTKRLSVGA